jgi:hypothetical protein
LQNGVPLQQITIFINYPAMKSKIISVILLLALVSVNAFAVVEGGGGGDVAVPLDGGLLSILGAAGVAYFVARRKKKNAE